MPIKDREGRGHAVELFFGCVGLTYGIFVVVRVRVVTFVPSAPWLYKYIYHGALNYFWHFSLIS